MWANVHARPILLLLNVLFNGVFEFLEIYSHKVVDSAHVCCFIMNRISYDLIVIMVRSLDRLITSGSNEWVRGCLPDL